MSNQVEKQPVQPIVGELTIPGAEQLPENPEELSNQHILAIGLAITALRNQASRE